MKKLFALILTAVMLIGVLPLGIFAETTESKVSGQLTWTLDKETMTLTISGEGEMDDYLEGKKPNPFFAYREQITTVIIEEGVTSIGAHAFQNYKRLSGIKMPETLESIGFGAFENTLSLESIEFPKSLKTLSDIFLMSEPADIMVFRGNAPALVDWSGFYREDNNNSPYLTRIFYMEDDLTWTKEAKAAFGEGVVWNDDSYNTTVPKEELPFKDVKEKYWYYDSVEYVYNNGIMTGTAEDKFSPNMNLTRAQMVQMLFNMSGEDKADYMGKSNFDDVSTSAWFAPAVNWADKNGITKGVSETLFAPNKLITRQELARFLFVFAGYIDYHYTTPRAEIDNNDVWCGFNDTTDIAAWAKDAVSWAVAVGIIKGVSDIEIQPRATAYRCQAAMMLMIFDQYVEENKRITTGGFRVLADYIAENGEYGEGYWQNTYSYYYSIGEFSAEAEYSPSEDCIVLYVCGEQYKEPYFGAHAGCMEEAAVAIYGLASEYDFSYLYFPMGENDNTDIISYGVMTADGYDETEFCYGDIAPGTYYEDDYYLNNDEYTEFATQKRDAAVSAMQAFIDHLLSESGLEKTELFIEK